MKKIVAFIVFFVLLFVPATKASEVRTWTSADGKFTIDAELVGMMDDGKTVFGEVYVGFKIFHAAVARENERFQRVFRPVKRRAAMSYKNHFF